MDQISKSIFTNSLLGVYFLSKISCVRNEANKLIKSTLGRDQRCFTSGSFIYIFIIVIIKNETKDWTI